MMLLMEYSKLISITWTVDYPTLLNSSIKSQTQRVSAALSVLFALFVFFLDFGRDNFFDFLISLSSLQRFTNVTYKEENRRSLTGVRFALNHLIPNFQVIFEKRNTQWRTTNKVRSSCSKNTQVGKKEPSLHFRQLQCISNFKMKYKSRFPLCPLVTLFMSFFLLYFILKCAMTFNQLYSKESAMCDH